MPVYQLDERIAFPRPELADADQEALASRRRRAEILETPGFSTERLEIRLTLATKRLQSAIPIGSERWLSGRKRRS